MILREVGLECEYWLLEGENIMEAPAYNFPADEMGFLIELRSAWGSIPIDIVASLCAELDHAKRKAKQLGFEVVELAWLPVENPWKEHIAEKYHHAGMPDNTRNIYGKPPVTQHTGLRGGRATAGCHIHFSMWDVVKERFIWFTKEQIEEIVARMDYVFREEIDATDRIAGEWEMKGIGDDSGRPHGFEYRSLPATVGKIKAAIESLKILNRVTEVNE